jgi:NADPH:quinone reductase-like Zn-dependent oxidoreductase
MRTLVAAPEGTPLSTDNALDAGTLLLDGQRVSFALLDCRSEAFDPAAESNLDRALVRVLGFSLNFRDKAMMRTTTAATHGIGSEFVAEVVAVGARVDRLSVGQRVIGEMSYPSNGILGTTGGVVTNAASRELQRVHTGKLVPVPRDMPDEVAAGFVLGAQTAYGMVRRLAVQPGEKVLVTAATSNTSLFGLQALRRRGAHIVALTRSGAARARLERLGAHHVIELTSTDDLSPVAYLARAWGGFDAVFDAFSDVYFPNVLGVMALGARYITCGIADQRWVLDGASVDPDQQWKHIVKALIVRNITLIGNCLGRNEDLQHALADWSSGALEVVLDSVHTGVPIGPFLDRTYNAAGRFGKVVYLYR